MFGRRLAQDVEDQEESVDGKKLQGQRGIALGQDSVQAIPIGRPEIVHERHGCSRSKHCRLA